MDLNPELVAVVAVEALGRGRTWRYEQPRELRNAISEAHRVGYLGRSVLGYRFR